MEKLALPTTDTKNFDAYATFVRKEAEEPLAQFAQVHVGDFRDVEETSDGFETDDSASSSYESQECPYE